MAQSSFGLSFGWGLWEYILPRLFKTGPGEIFNVCNFEDECTFFFSLKPLSGYWFVGASKVADVSSPVKTFANVVFSQGADQITLVI